MYVYIIIINNIIMCNINIKYSYFKTHKNRVDIYQRERKCRFSDEVPDSRLDETIGMSHSFIQSVSQQTAYGAPAPTTPGNVLGVVPVLTICHLLKTFAVISVNPHNHPYVVGNIIVLIHR